MAAKRKRLRAPTTQSGFTAVLESIRLENRVVAESLTGLRSEVQEMRTEMMRRFGTLEAAVLELGIRVKPSSSG
ncbi:MAG TPA: hypothetical protein VFA20_00150 [Myxococcaceae bacterium]|nr:hypothetical protein [Myxococcaceae bacterium]